MMPWHVKNVRDKSFNSGGTRKSTLKLGVRWENGNLTVVVVNQDMQRRETKRRRLEEKKDRLYYPSVECSIKDNLGTCNVLFIVNCICKRSVVVHANIIIHHKTSSVRHV